ncbi:MAG: hypothetical protein ACOC80_12630 [Petrotogales bacterium]
MINDELDIEEIITNLREEGIFTDELIENIRKSLEDYKEGRTSNWEEIIEETKED